jgi:DNA-directed RNA polymerase subunit RPC12/RpoP/ribosomal protein L37AE/L43A
MAKKSIGFVELIWTCPRCTTKNPGPNKFCTACGAPQPENVTFEQAPDAKLITDAEKIARAKAGPDIHCPYCNARNPAGSKFCGACGGDQSGAKARASGGVVGAFSQTAAPAAPVVCPSCGTSNSAGASACSNCGAQLAGPRPAAPLAAKAGAAGPAISRKTLTIGGGVGAVLLLLCVGIAILSARSKGVTASVVRVEWMRSLAIEAIAPVEREGWWDEIPSGAQQGSCELKYRYSQDQPAANSREVCGTPYTVDTGTGIGEVVQECVYEVSEDWCSYTVMDWNTVEVTSLGAADLQPVWPSRALASDERYGDRQESYTVVFEAGTKTYTITPESEAEFRRYSVGSEWVLNVNTFGSVLSLEPAN